MYFNFKYYQFQISLRNKNKDKGEDKGEDEGVMRRRDIKNEEKQAESKIELNPEIKHDTKITPSQGAKKWGKKSTISVTHVDTLNEFDDEDVVEHKPQKIEKYQPPPKPVYEEPKESKFISKEVRDKLFGKDIWVNKNKDKRENRNQNKRKDGNNFLKNSKLRRTPVPVSAVNAISHRKASSASNTSAEKPAIKSFTPEGEEYDYEALCEFEPRLRSVMIENKNQDEISKHKYTLNWQNKMTRYYLNKAILHYDYKLEYFELPEDEGLVPTVPSRREYIHWIRDLISESECSDGEVQSLSGIDVGVGASAIYPLIGVKEYGWKFTGTDIWEESLKIAQEIIDRNNLNEFIQLKHQADPKKIFDEVIPLEGTSYEYDFCMCNPPFFSSIYDRTERRSVKTIHSRKEEDVTEGGEIGFLWRMVKESVKYKNRIKWFTAFIGRKMDFVFLWNYLQWMLDDEFLYTSGTIEMGHTKRWLIGWSFKTSKTDE